MNLKRTYKALLLIVSLLFISAFPAVDIQAQSINSRLEGTWVLDSVQVKEVTSESISERTFLPEEDNKYNNNWMMQFTLNTGGFSSFMEKKGITIADIPYTIERKSGNTATLTICGVDYKVLNVELLSDKTMLITHAYTTEENPQVTDISWKMYYRKSDK